MNKYELESDELVKSMLEEIFKHKFNWPPPEKVQKSSIIESEIQSYNIDYDEAYQHI